MAKKSLGYTRLVWTCPSCDTKNPGDERVCARCGTPQPDDVEFEQAAHEEILTDEADIAKAEAGPDVHCYYCGTRNAADATNCRQCGADLTQAAARQAGQVLGAHRDEEAEPINCSACGQPNPPDAGYCRQCGAPLKAEAPRQEAPAGASAVTASRDKAKTAMGGAALGVVGIIGLVIVLACVGVFFLFGTSSDTVRGQVIDVSWERIIAIEEEVPVEYEAWHDEIPAESLRGQCTQRVRSTQDEPAPNAREVCGTPYTVDTGTGFGEVVQDCQYEVMEDWCTYTVDEWQEVSEMEASGTDLHPQWPGLNLTPGQREGEREETYRCIISTPEGTYTYSTSQVDLFNRCEIGTRWDVSLNRMGGVMSMDPIE